jgi:hypothetical protein
MDATGIAGLGIGRMVRLDCLALRQTDPVGDPSPTTTQVSISGYGDRLRRRHTYSGASDHGG